MSTRRAGQRTRSVTLTWIACAVVLAAAVVLGRAVAEQLSEHVLAIALAFAGGAVLASLADTLMPEAFEHGRPLDAFATAAGFFLSFCWLPEAHPSLAADRPAFARQRVLITVWRPASSRVHPLPPHPVHLVGSQEQYEPEPAYPYASNDRAGLAVELPTISFVTAEYTGLTGGRSGVRRSRLFRWNCPLRSRHPAVQVGLREFLPRRNVGKLAEKVERLRDPRAAKHGRVAAGDDLGVEALHVVHNRLKLVAIQQGGPRRD